MDLIAEGETMHGGTYNSNPIATSAVLATLSEVSKPGFYERLTRLGERLANGLVEIIQNAGLPATWTGVGPLFQVWFADTGPRDYREAVPIVQNSPFHSWARALLARGVLLQPTQDKLWLISGAHTEGDVDETLNRSADALREVVARKRIGTPT